MSDILTEFQAFLDPKAKGGIKGIAKLEITGEGTLMLSEDGAEIADTEADVTLKASEATFRAILSGDQNPVTAFMSGKLKVDGNAQRALKVSSILTA
jgi:putative sterol carrier protein